MEANASAVKGVIYARYSSAGQRDESIEGQLRDCHAYAKANGILIVGEYCDRALTGTSDKRPEFQRMIRDSARGQFSVVICWKNDRFARSRYDSAVYKYRLKQNGVRLLYAKEVIPEGPEGIILESIMEGFAEYYSANLSQNVKRGNYDSALKRQTLGQMVYGLCTGPDGRFAIDPVEGPVVRRIFQEYVSGKPAIRIAEDLNRDGYRTMRAQPFKKNSLHNILRNQKYMGIYNVCGVYDEHGIPPIVDRETFEKAQRMLEQHRRAPNAKRVEGGFLLTTKLFCGECGAAMTGESCTSHQGTIYYYYSCVNRKQHKCDMVRLPKDWLEDEVVRALSEIILSDEVIQEFADRFMDWQEKHRAVSKADGLKTRLRQVETALKNNMLLIDGGLVTDSIKSHMLDLESERADLLKGIAKAEIEEPELPRDAVVWFLESFRGGDLQDVSWRIQLVDTFLDTAWVFKDGRLVMQLNYGGPKNKVTLKTALQAISEGSPLHGLAEDMGLEPTGRCRLT